MAELAPPKVDVEDPGAHELGKSIGAHILGSMQF
jgi:hypothetical protein